MKKLNYLIAGFFMITALVSCEKEKMDDGQLSAIEKKGVKVVITENLPSSPVSVADITPYMIPGVNNGGNRTCTEVGIAFMNDANYFTLCGDKIDYEEGNFEGGFPDGLNVTTDGIFVSFDMDGCLEIGGNLYSVGAVIVKGSDQANVYFYPDGMMSDSNLAAPINSSGGPAGLSNLTFCFVECEDVEPDPIVIAVKAWIHPDATTYLAQGPNSAAESSGDYIFSGCTTLGVNYYPATPSFLMHDFYYGDDIGTVTVEEGVNSLIITVDLKDEGELYRTWLYVGSLEGLNSTVVDGCPDYYNDPLWLYDGTAANSITFTVPY